MPLFDPSIIPAECGPPRRVETVNVIIDRLHAMKIESLPVVGADRTRNLVRCYIQAHLRRCLTFIEAGHAEFYAGRSLVAYACARANYENVAAFCDFAEDLIPLLTAGDHKIIRKFVEVRTFATRLPELIEEYGEATKAKNILTQIDKMNRRYGPFREAYDHLSEIVHPNSLGAAVQFVALDMDNDPGVARFPDGGKNPNWALTSLIGSGFMLGYVLEAISNIESHLGQARLAEPSL